MCLLVNCFVSSHRCCRIYVGRAKGVAIVL